ncbi:MAG: caspase family protein, partial [Candidatus Electrothrix sp.]
MTESSTRGLRTGKDKASRTDPSKFRKSHAIIIGIDQYSNGISPLATAVNDARRLAQILEEQYDYSITLLVEEVTRSRLQAVFEEELPEQIDPNDRLLIYFAGHGVALDGENGPEGYLILQDATLDEDSFWPMTELHKALDDLPCQHMLAILDCCFAGAFRWSSTRDLQPLPSVIYRERYERFLRDPAWQVITSAAYNQKALDTLSGYVVGTHGVAQDEEQPHSPFALSLFEALHGAADSTPKDGDGIITATELYIYLRDQVEVNAEQLIDHRQTPGLWPLNKHRQGEFIFLLPDHELDLPPAPDLTEENNPYKGLSAYEKGDSKLFFGRTDLITKLQEQVQEQSFTVVLGASGTGKSSLVKAGLLPALENNSDRSEKEVDAVQGFSWFIPEKILRPGTNPAAALRSLLITELPGVRPERERGSTATGLIGQWRKKNSNKRLLLVIDQFEEIITLCQEEQEREDFIGELMQALEEHSEVLRIVLTLRSDFEAQISQNYLKDWWQEDNRFVVPP